MDVLISRQDAAKILCNWCGVCPEDKRDIINCDDICPEFARIPSAQQWIPCSERLPEEDGQEVLFSSRFGRVHIGKYHDDSSLNKWFSYRDKFRLMNDEVTAWMPLPEPYKEGVE